MTENTSGDSSKDRHRDGEENGGGSIFSQNLELDFLPQKNKLPELEETHTQQHKNPSERMTYFRLEAGKTIDILRGELEGFGSSGGGLEMVDELWRSWQELWGDETELEAVEFTELFRVARQALESAVRRGADEFSTPEKLALSRLMQGMEKLAAGEADEEDLQWARESGNRVLRMIAAWDSGGRPEHDGGEDDISGSVNEWFSQVSQFIPQAPEDAEDEDEISYDEPVPEHEDVEDQPDHLEPPLDEDVFVAAGSDGAEVDEPRQPSVEPVDDVSMDEPVELREEDTAAEEADGSVADTEAPAPSSSEDIVTEGTSEGWLSEVYFWECCQEAAEAIRNNIDRLTGSSAARTARMLGDHVDYIVQLSVDFGIAELDLTLDSLCRSLRAISAASSRESSSDVEMVEQLLSAVSRLENECERVVVLAG